MRKVRSTTLGTLIVAAAMVAAGGCAQNQTSSINDPTPQQAQPTGLAALFAPKPQPELNLKQGQKLMADIMKNPKRADHLTPQEKRFLAKAAATKQYLDDEEAAGRR